MGGKAFSQSHPELLFPRILPVHYQALLASLRPRLARIYKLVGTPAEAPEKPDHGDVDFLVAGPINASTPPTPEDVRDLLGAAHYLPMPENRTSNYALRADWTAERDAFCQVDVHVCADEDEFRRILFFHSYGDLGMILGIIARTVGLAMGTSGLKASNAEAPATHPRSFPLSTSFDAILPFFGLSLDRWRAGFATQRDVFAWIASSRFFDPRRVPDPAHRQKVKRERAMFYAFQEWAKQLRDSGAWVGRPPLPDAQAVVEEALDRFGRREAYYAVVRDNERRARLKQTFTGHVTADVLGMDVARDWREVKQVMDAVRQDIGEDVLATMEQNEVRQAIIAARARMDSIRR